MPSLSALMPCRWELWVAQMEFAKSRLNRQWGTYTRKNTVPLFSEWYFFSPLPNLKSLSIPLFSFYCLFLHPSSS